jgi:hypothetical protein
MTNTDTDTAAAFPVSAAGEWTCTIEDGVKPRTVQMTRYLLDETITLFRVDGWDYRVHSVETSDQGDVYVTMIRQTRKGHDYKNGLGISTSLADLAAERTSSPQRLAGVVARIRATVVAVAEPAPAVHPVTSFDLYVPTTLTTSSGKTHLHADGQTGILCGDPAARYLTFNVMGIVPAGSATCEPCNHAARSLAALVG